MLEQLVAWLGRNVKIRGTGRALSAFYPCNHCARRYVHGVRARSDGLLMELDSRNWIDWNLLFRGDFEPHLTRLLRRLAPPGSGAVDIGANLGAHTLTLAQTVGPQGTVFAFEPNPLVWAILGRNVALNGLNHVRLFDCALGDKPGVLPLRVPKADSAEYSNLGLASLVALDTPHDLVDVQIRTIDDVVREEKVTRVDLVKIDVQGFECNVLAGMRETLKQHSPVIIFEYEEWAWEKADVTLIDAAGLLRTAGYSLWRIGDGREVYIEPLGRTDSLPAHIDLFAARYDEPRLETLLS